MKQSLFLLLICANLSAGETSVFGAGNLDSSNPYGLTETEKHIVKNRDTLKNIESSTRLQTNKVLSIEERIDGLQSIIDGMNQKNHNSSISVKKIEAMFAQRVELYNQDKEEIQTELAILKEITKANSENNKKLKLVLTEFSQLIDTINSNYVSKSEFNTLVKDINGFKKLISTEIRSVNRSIEDSSSSSISNPDLANRAYKRFKASQYTKAIEDYEVLIKNKYKPARAHYMVGESYYYLKNYSEALAFFKESAARYDKADYMATLMLHSAMCMKYAGDTDNAKTFLSAVISDYPATKEANSAQKELDKLLK